MHASRVATLRYLVTVCVRVCVCVCVCVCTGVRQLREQAHAINTRHTLQSPGPEAGTYTTRPRRALSQAVSPDHRLATAHPCAKKGAWVQQMRRCTRAAGGGYESLTQHRRRVCYPSRLDADERSPSPTSPDSNMTPSSPVLLPPPSLPPHTCKCATADVHAKQ
jgi:hypothetical protein